MLQTRNTKLLISMVKFLTAVKTALLLPLTCSALSSKYLRHVMICFGVPFSLFLVAVWCAILYHKCMTESVCKARLC
jgi:hypothetical protein